MGKSTEFNSTPPKNDKVSPSPYKRVGKNYIKAEKFASPSQKRTNEAVEGSYHALIDHVKKLYAALPNESDRVIVEMNRSEEPLNPISIYCFLTRHFYFYLECDITFHYRIEYQMQDCPFEKEILQGLQETIMRSHSTEVMKMSNYSEFFNEVLRVQPNKFKRVL
jgi:hypothetical protein